MTYRRCAAIALHSAPLFSPSNRKKRQMSKKHFEAIAFNLYSAQPLPHETDAFEQWKLDCEAIADACERFNNHFDRDRFLMACGFEIECNH